MKFKWMFGSMVLVLLLSGLMFTWQGVSQETFSNATLKYGSSGQDVHELQGRLQFLGYYHGNIDGAFGWQTQRAVKDFQYKFGLKVDGIAGSDTKAKLTRATKNWSPGANQNTGGGGAGNQTYSVTNEFGLSENDLKLMANAVYGEARGEPFEGQVAVAAVILNRVRSDKFPDTVSGVIFQPRAFTAVDDGQIWLEPNETARRAVQQALNGWDPTNNCLYYFNPDTATSAWIWTRPQVKRIGKHIFCM